MDPLQQLRNANRMTVTSNLLSPGIDNGQVYSSVDAFRFIDRGNEAEADGRYKEAVQSFLSASEQLAGAAENEADPRVNQLLTQKAAETLTWAEKLAQWRERGCTGPVPFRRSHGVAVQVAMTEQTDQHRYRHECTHMQYTPVSTIEPKNFSHDGYALRCVSAGRNPRMLIVITMYNEDPGELSATLRKCCNNIAYLQDHKLPGYVGEDAWKNILICIVSDGRTKAHPKTLQFLQQLGLFDEDAMTICSAGIDTRMHLFERTVILNRLENRGIRSFFNSKTAKIPPLQIVFALKEHNAGKLDSHLWFYHGFARQVQPEYTVLIDVGTLPTKTSFYKLLASMEVDQKVGGVCGEIAVEKPFPNLCNWIVAAQHFEYKISNILDKATESCAGFISVLPGAFSAYRYKAIRGAPLDAYFKSLTTSMAELGPFYGNMYLAEDRILCFELLARKNCSWTMLYVKDAIARTDVPTTLIDLIKQRRRWLNGSLFAMLYTLKHWGRVYTQSQHSFMRKITLVFQYVGMLLNTIFSWFLLGNFFVTCYFVIFYALEHNDGSIFNTRSFFLEHQDTMRLGFNTLYVAVIILQVVLGLGNRPGHVAGVYRLISLYYVMVITLTTASAVHIFVTRKETSLQAIVLAASTFGVYFIAALLHGELHHICLSFIQYYAMLPTMINILMIYSFCNLHDLSWGTKGMETMHAPPSGTKAEEKGEYKELLMKRKAQEAKAREENRAADAIRRRFDSFRSKLLILWLISNAGFVYLNVYFVPSDVFLPIVLILVALFNINRLFGSIMFLVYTFRQWLLLKCCLCCGILDKRYKKKLDASSKHAISTPKDPYNSL